MRLGEASMGVLSILVTVQTVLNKTFRMNLTWDSMGARGHAPRKQPPPTTLHVSLWQQLRLWAASPLTLFCFRALFSFMWGQSFPVTMALMSATGTDKWGELVSGSFMLQVGPRISAGRDGPAPRPTGLYELREGSPLCGCFAWTPWPAALCQV